MGTCTADAMALIGPRWCSIIVAILYNSLIQFLNESIFKSYAFAGASLAGLRPFYTRAPRLKCYLAAIRHLHIAKGVGDPAISAMPRLVQVLRGTRFDQSKGSKKPRVRLPITPSILQQLKKVWLSQAEGEDAIMLSVAAALYFFGFFRAGEICAGDSFDKSTHLSFGDISVDSLEKPTSSKVRLSVRQALTSAGIDCSVYCGHSFQSAAATTAHR